jgi:hypothetical protein
MMQEGTTALFRVEGTEYIFFIYCRLKTSTYEEINQKLAP